MKKTALFAIALLAIKTAAHAVPVEINYQGVLTDQAGNPINGVRAIQLKIYDAPTGGNITYTEDLGNVSVQDGIYSFSFGANGTSNPLTAPVSGITDAIIGSNQAWVETSINEVSQSPRQKILTVPYALVAKKSEDAQLLNASVSTLQTQTSGLSSNLTAVQGQVNGVSTNLTSISSNLTNLQSQSAMLSSNFSTINATVGALGSNLTALQSKPSYAIIAHPPFSTSTAGESTVSGNASTFVFYSQDVYILPDADILKVKYSAAWSSDAWDGSRRSYVLDIVVKIGTVIVHQLTFNGVAFNLNNFNFEKTIDADALNIPRGYASFSVQATKRDYGSLNNAVKLYGGNCSFWMVGEPR